MSDSESEYEKPKATERRRGRARSPIVADRARGNDHLLESAFAVERSGRQ